MLVYKGTCNVRMLISVRVSAQGACQNRMKRKRGMQGTNQTETQTWQTNVAGKMRRSKPQWSH